MSDIDSTELAGQLRALNEHLACLPTIVESLADIRDKLDSIHVSLGGYEFEGERVPAVVTLLQSVRADVCDLKLAIGGYVADGQFESGPVLDKLAELQMTLESTNATLESIDTGISLLDK